VATLTPKNVTATKDPPEHTLQRVKPSREMAYWTLAMMQASAKDPPETVRSSLVLGFVYVAHVDAERAKVKLLAPLPERLGDRPLIWGEWPELHVNLLG
jgi:polyribonucleotide 5'-hydroxyl-kinase